MNSLIPASSSPVLNATRLLLLGLLLHGLLVGSPETVRATWCNASTEGEAKEAPGQKTASEESESAIIRPREDRTLAGPRRACRPRHPTARRCVAHTHVSRSRPAPAQPDVEGRNGIGGPLRC